MRWLLLLQILLLSARAEAQDYNVAFNPRGGASQFVTQVLLGGSNNTIPATATTVYLFPAGFTTVTQTATESDFEAIVLNGTVSELRVQLSATVGTGSDAAQFRVRHCDPTCAAASDDLECTVTAGTSSCSDTSSSFSVADGDRLTMELITTDTPAGVTPFWSFKWVGTDANESMIVANYIGDHATNTECPAASGTGNGAISCGSVLALAVPAAENFTITGLRARADADLGVLDSRQLTLYKNGSADSLCRVTLDDTTQSASDACSVSFNTSATPDYITIEDDPGATNAFTGNIAFTFTLEQASQRFQQGVCGQGASPSTTANNFIWASGVGNSWNATESARDMVADGFTQTGFAFNGTPAPGASADYLYSLRDDTASAVGCTVTNPATSCSGSGSSAVADASLIDVLADPSATTPTAPTNWCLSWSGTGS